MYIQVQTNGVNPTLLNVCMYYTHATDQLLLVHSAYMYICIECSLQAELTLPVCLAFRTQYSVMMIIAMEITITVAAEMMTANTISILPVHGT